LLDSKKSWRNFIGKEKDSEKGEGQDPAPKRRTSVHQQKQNTRPGKILKDLTLYRLHPDQKKKKKKKGPAKEEGLTPRPQGKGSH